MSDITERLLTRTDYADREEAAGEIARLRNLTSAQAQDIVALGQLAGKAEDQRARIAALEEALEPFVRSLTMQEVEATVRDLPPSENADRLLYAMVGDARRARVALAKGGEG